MKEDIINDSDHISRYCPFQKLNEDGWPGPVAFQLGDNEEYVSVDWLEFFLKDSREEQLQNVRSILKKRGYTLQKYAKLAVLNVGYTKDKVKHGCNNNHEIYVAHRPTLGANIDSHSGIFKCNSLYIATLIALCTKETYPAQDP